MQVEEHKGSRGSSQGKKAPGAAEPNKAKGAAGYKRKFNESKQKKSEETAPAAGQKKRKLDASQKKGNPSQQQAADDLIVEQAEKSLGDLKKNHAKFFEKIASSKSKRRVLKQCAKSKDLGNQTRSFAKQQKGAALEDEEDQRLQTLVDQFKTFQTAKGQEGGATDLFEGKRVLDIGCHNGAMSVQAAAKYNPASVVGVDIDPALVKAAIANLHRIVNREETTKTIAAGQQEANGDDQSMPAEGSKEQKTAAIMDKISKLPKSIQQTLSGEAKSLKKGSEDTVDTAALRAKVQFKNENYVEDPATGGDHFDVVMCLSTIKWIHFNNGDVGLKTLFLKAFAQLASGGLFIFDAQPWKSYKKLEKKPKKKATPTAAKKGTDSQAAEGQAAASEPATFVEPEEVKKEKKADKPAPAIDLKPHLFKAYLTSIGFEYVTKAQIGGSDIAGRSKNPMFIYKKC